MAGDHLNFLIKLLYFMRILFVSPAYPPIKNAIGEYVRWLALELSKNNHEVAILTINSNHRCDDVKFRNRDLDLEHIKYEDNRIDIFPCVKNWKIDFQNYLIKVRAYYKPDVISLQYEPYSYASKGLPFFLVKSFKNIFYQEITITFHEVYARDYLWGNKFYYILYFLQTKIAKKLCQLSFVCFTALDLYMKVFQNDKIKKLYVGSNIQAEVIQGSQQSSFFESEKIFKLVSFGIKNYDIILQSLKLVKNKTHIPFEYHIVGDLPTAVIKKVVQNIETLQINENVWIHGFMEADEISKLFSQSHLFIDNNYVDNHKRGGTTLKSGSVAAAFQYGLPVLGYKGDMTDGILNHKKNIWFCNSSTPAEISQEIQFLMHKPDLLFNLHLGSNELYNTYLSWPAIAKTFTAILSERIKENC